MEVLDYIESVKQEFGIDDAPETWRRITHALAVKLATAAKRVEHLALPLLPSSALSNTLRKTAADGGRCRKNSATGSPSTTIATVASKYCPKENGAAYLCIGFHCARAKEVLQASPIGSRHLSVLVGARGRGQERRKLFPLSIRAFDACHPYWSCRSTDGN
jgi:hypothetical protein